LLQDALNPFVYGKGELQIGKNKIRVGDRVMQIVNNYELPFKRFSADGTVEEGEGVFNGDIGVVQNIDKLTGEMQVLYDDNRLASYYRQDYSDVQLAYAITIHKSQGSEFEVVVVPLVNGPPSIINRNLLYTAITRAKRAVVLVGSKKVLAMMVHNNYIATRTTNLCRFLQYDNAAIAKLMKNFEVTTSEETEEPDWDDN
jgi:exodeoxyribonuclease V alpha subunit